MLHIKFFKISLISTYVLTGLVPVQILPEKETLSDQGEDDDFVDEALKEEEFKLFTDEHLEKLYVFALVWGIGGFLENDDRTKFDHYIKEKCGDDLNLPKNTYKNREVRTSLHR